MVELLRELVVKVKERSHCTSYGNGLSRLFFVKDDLNLLHIPSFTLALKRWFPVKF